MKSTKKNILYNLIKTSSAIVFPLITFPYISRTLQPENIGKCDFAQSIVSYFSLLATLGITTYAVRECSVQKGRKELSDTASQIFSINMITTVFSYCLLALTLFCFKNLSGYKIIIVVQSLSILFTTLGADWLNTAMEDFRYITIRTFLFQILSLILMFIFVRRKEDYLTYSVILLLSGSGANILNIWHRKKFCTVKFTFKFNLKKHLPPILIMFAMLLSQSIFNNADKTMLGIMKGDYSVGIYSTAVKIINILRQLVLSILWVIMPRLSQYFADNDYTSINKLLYRILNFTVSLGLPCIVGVELLSDDIVSIVAGPGYEGTIPVLRILIISLFFSFFGGSFLGNIIMLPSRREKTYMVACCISTIINIVSNAILIPLYGACGAAITTAFSELLILLILLPHVDRNIAIPNKKQLFFAPIVGCIFISIICLIFKFNISNMYIRIFSSILGSAFAYGLILLVMKDKIACELLSSIKVKHLKRMN